MLIKELLKLAESQRITIAIEVVDTDALADLKKTNTKLKFGTATPNLDGAPTNEVSVTGSKEDLKTFLLNVYDYSEEDLKDEYPEVL